MIALARSPEMVQLVLAESAVNVAGAQHSSQAGTDKNGYVQMLLQYTHHTSRGRSA
jgi:hypothetical protein